MRETPIDVKATDHTRACFDRLARFRGLWFFSRHAEQRASLWRRALWLRVQGPRVLEVGIGVGKNMPYYPSDVQVTAIDFSPQMLKRAYVHAVREAVAVTLYEADVQSFPLRDARFDSVVATFVFCAVPNPVRGLEEIRRVLVPGGQLLLLDHVLSHQPMLRLTMRTFNLLIVRLLGANINRDTVANVQIAGFVRRHVENFRQDVVILIEARSPVTANDLFHTLQCS